MQLQAQCCSSARFMHEFIVLARQLSLPHTPPSIAGHGGIERTCQIHDVEHGVGASRVVEKVTLALDVCPKIKKRRTKAGSDRNRQALVRDRLKEVVVAAVVQHGVDTCRGERVTGVLSVGRSAAL